MAAMAHAFMVGKFGCLAVSDGMITVPDMVTPRPFDPANPSSGLQMDVTCLVIAVGERKILVDTGSGHWFGPASGKLLQNLAAAGLDAAGIDTVLITHAHGDHIGANVDGDGNPVFRNARYMMHRLEWSYWMSRLEAEAHGPGGMLSIARHNLPAIRDRLELVEDRTSLVPGLECVLAPGHTPGSLMLMLSSGQDRLCCIGDLIHHETEMVNHDVFAIFDVDKDEAFAARQRLLPGLADPGLLIFSCHFPFPGLGHIVRDGGRLAWRPSQTASG